MAAKTPKDIDMINSTGSLPNPFPGLGLTQQTTVTVATTTTPTTTYKFKKAGTKGNLIAVVLDESGSMNSCYDSTISGFNEFVAGQRAAKNAGDATLTLNKFDAPHIKTVFENLAIGEAPALDKKNYQPNGGTNLLDCIGYTIEQVNATLEKNKKKDRPGVIVLIMTDGEENSSRKYTLLEARNLVQTLKDKNYEVLFMGAEFKEIYNVAGSFGVALDKTINVNTHNLNSTMRGLVASGTNSYAAGSAAVSFTDKDKEKAVA